MVKQRETFYLGGYDPRGARYYYNLYKKQSALQSKINGIKFEVSSRNRLSKEIETWCVEATKEEKKTVTQYHFLGLDSFIRTSWKRSIFLRFKDLFFYLKTYFLSGVVFALIKASPYQIVILFAPVFYLLISVLMAFFVLLGLSELFSSEMPYYLAFFLSLYPSYKFLFLLVEVGEKLTFFWLLRVYVFCGQYVLKVPSEVEAYIEKSATHIICSLYSSNSKEIDEVLLVAHSIGTVMLIPILKKVLENLDKASIEKISVLTLGHCIPLISFLKEAKVFREEMDFISQKNMRWLDYASIVDGACFPFDYYEKLQSKHRPEYLSPKFHLLYEKSRYKRVKKNRFVVHFLYLMATDKAGAYDFFKLTAGFNRLGEREEMRK